MAHRFAMNQPPIKVESAEAVSVSWPLMRSKRTFFNGFFSIKVWTSPFVNKRRPMSEQFDFLFFFFFSPKNGKCDASVTRPIECHSLAHRTLSGASDQKTQFVAHLQMRPDGLNSSVDCLPQLRMQIRGPHLISPNDPNCRLATEWTPNDYFQRNALNVKVSRQDNQRISSRFVA